MDNATDTIKSTETTTTNFPGLGQMQVPAPCPHVCPYCAPRRPYCGRPLPQAIPMPDWTCRPYIYC